MGALLVSYGIDSFGPLTPQGVSAAVRKPRGASGFDGNVASVLTLSSPTRRAPTRQPTPRRTHASAVAGRSSCPPQDAATRRRMQAVAREGTGPEGWVAGVLRAIGSRARRHDRALPGTPDFTLRAARVVILVHGCFWHAHARCRRAELPRHNRAFWRAKFASNRTRDGRVVRALGCGGWRVLIVWECQIRTRPRPTARRITSFVAGVQ